MIDLHTHSLLSDGELVPSELIRRAKVRGYRMIGISDHVDISNIEKVVGSVLKLSEKIRYYEGITVLPGVEITHVPKGMVREMIALARKLGIFYVVVHGETLAEPVEEGTNREAIEGGGGHTSPPRHHIRGRCDSREGEGHPARNKRKEGALPFKWTCGRPREEGRCKTDF